MKIVETQTFKVGGAGLLGDGVYLTPDRAKARQYRRDEHGMHDGGKGVILKCRVKLGLCYEIPDGKLDNEVIMGGAA